MTKLEFAPNSAHPTDIGSDEPILEHSRATQTALATLLTPYCRDPTTLANTLLALPHCENIFTNPLTTRLDLKLPNGVLAMLDAVRALNSAAIRLTKTDPILSSHSALIKYLKDRLRNDTTETLIVIFLNKKHRLIAEEHLTSYSPHKVDTDLGTIARLAIKHNASNVILAHNHPSGEPTPSKSDLDMTDALTRLLRALDITLIDHIIIAAERMHSMHSNNQLTHPTNQRTARTY